MCIYMYVASLLLTVLLFYVLLKWDTLALSCVSNVVSYEVSAILMPDKFIRNAVVEKIE